MPSLRRPDRAYLVRFGAATLAYRVLLPLCIAWAERLGASPARYLVVSLPVLPVAAGIWALWRYVREADELQSRKVLDGLAFAVAATVLVSFVLGMCQYVGAPAVSWVWVPAVLMMGFGVGTAIASWKYR